MHVHYSHRRGGELAANYVCSAAGRLFGDPLCQSIVGTAIDAAIGTAARRGRHADGAASWRSPCSRRSAARLDEADRLRHRQVERAQYEADLAAPLHAGRPGQPTRRRLAGGRLERQAARPRRGRRRSTSASAPPIGSSSTSTSASASSPSPPTSPPSGATRTRRSASASGCSRLLDRGRHLIKQRQITAAVRFRGGATTTLTLPRPLTAQQLRATHADVRQQIDALLDEYTDAQVAHILNERGLRTGAGDAFDSSQRPVGPLLGQAQEPQGALARRRHADRASRSPARSASAGPPSADGATGAHQGAHLQRPRRMAILAARRTCLHPAERRSKRHGQSHCGRCSMKDAPSTSTCSTARTAAAASSRSSRPSWSGR